MTGCNGDSKVTDQARLIYQKALELENSGLTAEAMAEYENLASYPESEYCTRASRDLQARGITLSAARQSWTVTELFRVRNALIEAGELEGRSGDPMVKLTDTDAWGRPLWVEYFTGCAYRFAVRSAGAEGVMSSGDDLRVYDSSVPEAGPGGKTDDDSYRAAKRFLEPGRAGGNCRKRAESGGKGMKKPGKTDLSGPSEVRADLSELLKGSGR